MVVVCAASNAFNGSVWMHCCVRVRYDIFCDSQMIEYINRNAYVITAMEGTGYCVSASRAFELISANPFRVTAVGWVSW